ncbi:MAG TPA: LysR family transcriptional regulator [Alphaproteobacteria bacterium]|jgi:DNA-binding transcriptional LysR family regulator
MLLNGKVEDLNDVAVFVEVAARGSFTRAAANLHLSLPSVSRRVKNLESALQTQLFVRSTRHLSLTEAGRFYFEKCAKLLNEMDLIHEEVGDLTRGLKGSIRIYSPLGFGEQVMADIVLKFGKLYPDIVVELRVGDRSTNPTEKGVDIAVRTADLKDSSLASRELGSLNYHLCASAKYLAERGTPTTLEELEEHNCLVHTAQPSPDLWEFDVDGAKRLIPVKGDLRSNSGAVIFHACLAGAGIARLPEYDVQTGQKHGQLEMLFPRQLNFTRPLYAYYPRSNHLPARIDRFLNFLEAEIGPYLRS